MNEIEVDAKRATLQAAQAILILLSLTFYNKGWMPSVHGSTIEQGEGRDIDIVLTQCSNSVLTEMQIVEILMGMGMEIMLDEARGRFRGLTGLLHGYALDITIVRYS